MTTKSGLAIIVSLMAFSVGCQKSRTDCASLTADECFQLGQELAQGAGGKANLKLATKIFEDACAKNSKNACAMAGLLQVSGLEGRGPENVRVFGLFSKACGNPSGAASADDDISACAMMATMLESAAVPEDEELRSLARAKACSGGDSESCGSGYKYFLPASLPSKPEELAAEASKAKSGCDAHNAEACFRLGAIYNRGIGVEWKWLDAEDAFGTACLAGHRRACSNSGLMRVGMGAVGGELYKSGLLQFVKAAGDFKDPELAFNASLAVLRERRLKQR